MVAYVITFFLQVLTYVVLQLETFFVTSNITLMDIFLWFMIITVLLFIVRRLMRSDGIG